MKAQGEESRVWFGKAQHILSNQYCVYTKQTGTNSTLDRNVFPLPQCIE